MTDNFAFVYDIEVYSWCAMFLARKVYFNFSFNVSKCFFSVFKVKSGYLTV